MISGLTHEVVTLKPNLDITEPDDETTISKKRVSTAVSGSTNVLTSLNLLSTGRLESSHKMVVGLPWSEYVARPDATDRYRALAQAANSHLLAVDVPGMNAESSNMPHALSREISCGNFDTVARMQWEALKESSLETADQITMLGYSMGAHVVSSLVRTAPEGTHIDRLVLWESISRRQNIASLAAKFVLEERRSARYKQENPAWMQEPIEIAKALPAKRIDYLRYGAAMARGGLGVSFIKARSRETITKETEVIIVGGSKSYVSTPEDNLALANFMRLAAKLAAVRHIELKGESHSMINSTPRMAAALQKIVS